MYKEEHDDPGYGYWTYGTSVFITTATAAAATVLFSQHFKQ